MAAASIDEAIIVHAKKQSSLTAIIGSRFYHIIASQRAKLPYGVLNIVDPSNISEHFGKDRMGQHLMQATFTSDADKTPCDAFLAAHALMDIMANYRGTMESVVVRYMELRGPLEIPGPEPNQVLCVVELIPHYEEP